MSIKHEAMNEAKRHFATGWNKYGNSFTCAACSQTIKRTTPEDHRLMIAISYVIARVSR